MFKTVLIWRSSCRMYRNKNLLILYYLWKKLSKFSNAQKKSLPMLFFFQLRSTANSKFSFCVSLCEINCIKTQIISLVLNPSTFYFIRGSLCFTHFNVIIRQRLKKKFKLGERSHIRNEGGIIENAYAWLRRRGERWVGMMT